MRVESLSCNNCGAPLDVPADVNYLTCSHCGSRLSVNRSGNAHYTEIIEQLSKRAQQMEGDIERLQIENELERLDREWQQDRERYMLHGKYGARIEPTSGYLLGNALVMGLAGIMLCFGLSTIANWGSAASPIWLIAVVIIGMMAAYLVYVWIKMGEYSSASDAHQRKRQELVSKLEAQDR